MRGSILSYFDMCQTEKTSLQRGMNFRLRGGHSVFLMSVRKGAPYHDRVEDEGLTLIYEGHDAAKTAGWRSKIGGSARTPGLGSVD